MMRSGKSFKPEEKKPSVRKALEKRSKKEEEDRVAKRKRGIEDEDDSKHTAGRAAGSAKTSVESKVKLKVDPKVAAPSSSKRSDPSPPQAPSKLPTALNPSKKQKETAGPVPPPAHAPTKPPPSASHPPSKPPPSPSAFKKQKESAGPVPTTAFGKAVPASKKGQGKGEAAKEREGQWSKEELMRLMDAVRAECKGSPTLVSAPKWTKDSGAEYVARLADRLNMGSARVKAKLDELCEAHGASEEAFDTCDERIVKIKGGAARERHDSSWDTGKDRADLPIKHAGPGARARLSLDAPDHQGGGAPGGAQAPEDGKRGRGDGAFSKAAGVDNAMYQDAARDVLTTLSMHMHAGVGAPVPERSSDKAKTQTVLIDQLKSVKASSSSSAKVAAATAAKKKSEDLTQALTQQAKRRAEQDKQDRRDREETSKKRKVASHDDSDDEDTQASSRSAANAAAPAAAAAASCSTSSNAMPTSGASAKAMPTSAGAALKRDSGSASSGGQQASRASTLHRSPKQHREAHEPVTSRPAPPAARSLRLASDSIPPPPTMFEIARRAVNASGGEKAYADKDSTGVHGVSGIRDVVAGTAGKDAMQRALDTVRNRLAPSHIPSMLIGLESQLAEVKNLLEGCISRGANGSALLVGPRGRGKSALVRSVLRELGEKHTFPGFITLYLNGLVHTTDHAALRSIVKQLYTMDDLNAELEFEQELRSLGNAEHNMNFVFELVKRGRSNNQPVFFVLDEFHLFAMHPRQSLLYNLFDMTQSPSMQTVVLGLTPALSAVELLEKRVRSRFSGRQIFFMDSLQPEQALQIITSALTIPPEDVKKDKSKEDNKSLQAYTEAHNKRVSKLGGDAVFRLLLQPVFEATSDVGALLTWAMEAVCSLSTEDCLLRVESFAKPHAQPHTCDSLRDVMIGLSALELNMLAAMRRLVVMGRVPFTMEAVIAEFLAYVKANPQAAASVGLDMQVLPRGRAEQAMEAMCVNATEQLLQLELVALDNKDKALKKEQRPLRLTVDEQRISDLFARTLDVPSHLKTWATERLV